MLCPRCGSEAAVGSWRSRVRRKARVVWIQARCWRCPQCRTSCGPLQFLSPDLEDQNDAIAASVWRETFSEEMPPPMAGAGIRRLMRTSEGKARVAAAFGRVLEHQITGRKS